MKLSIRWVIALLLITPLSYGQKSLLWEISGNGLEKPSYVFGTYHLLTDAYLQTLPQVERTFTEAEAVMVEVELDEADQQKMMTASIMQGKTIPGLIDDEKDLALLQEEVQNTFKVGLNQFQSFKPSALMMTLVLVYHTQDLPGAFKKYTQGTPMDMYLLTKGREDGKTGLTLETLEEQLSILYDGYSLEEQAEQLVDFVRAKEGMKKMSHNIGSLYLEHNLKAMQKTSAAYFEKYAAGEEDLLIRPRNEKWLPQIREQISKESTFIAVGALHLPGEYGVLELLKKEGYKLKAVKK